MLHGGHSPPLCCAAASVSCCCRSCSACGFAPVIHPTAACAPFVRVPSGARSAAPSPPLPNVVFPCDPVGCCRSCCVTLYLNLPRQPLPTEISAHCLSPMGLS